MSVKYVAQRRAIPFSLKELELVAKEHPMDLYHKELMQWAAEEIKTLRAQVKAKESAA